MAIYVCGHNVGSGPGAGLALTIRRAIRRFRDLLRLCQFRVLVLMTAHSAL
jgi:hypothetical protein